MRRVPSGVSRNTSARANGWPSADVTCPLMTPVPWLVEDERTACVSCAQDELAQSVAHTRSSDESLTSGFFGRAGAERDVRSARIAPPLHGICRGLRGSGESGQLQHGIPIPCRARRHELDHAPDVHVYSEHVLQQPAEDDQVVLEVETVSAGWKFLPPFRRAFSSLPQSS